MELIIALFGLVLSFFFAGAESAFVTTNKVRFEIWLRKKIKSALAAKKYFKNPDLFLSTTLIGNNFANILTTTYATVYFIDFLDDTLTWAMITFTILLIGEILPKVLFRTHADRIILRIINLVRFFHFLFTPLIFLINMIINRFLQFLQIPRDNEYILVSKEDIAVLIREGKISGVVDENEHKIISRVLSLPDILVREAMIPRTSIEAVESNASLLRLRKIIIRTGYTKIPVYRETIDNITGVVFMYDLFNKPDSLKEIIRPVAYVPENKKCNELLQEFRNTNSSIAVVIDEYGGTAGLVTLEDVVEVLFGEFEDVRTPSGKSIQALNKTTWKIDPTETLENIREFTGLEVPDGNYETLAGYILSALGRIPARGDQLQVEDYRILITRASRKKIEEVRIIQRMSYE